MSDQLLSFYQARHETASPVGQQMQFGLDALTDEQFAQALNDAHLQAYGEPMSTGAPKDEWRITTEAKQMAAEPGKAGGKLLAAAGQGVVNAAFNMSRTVNEIGQWMSESDPNGIGKVVGDALQWTTVNEKPPQILPDSFGKPGIIEGAVTGITQFMVPFTQVNKMLGDMQVFKAAGASSAWMEKLAKLGNSAVKGAIAGLPVDFAAFDPIENNLANVAKQFGFLPEYMDFMAGNEDPKTAEEKLLNRVKAAAVNAPVGVIGEAALAVPGFVATGASHAYVMAAKAMRAVRDVNWSQMEKDGAKALSDSINERGTLNDVTRVPEIAAKQAAAVAKIVAGRIGRLTVPQRKAFENTGELPGMAELQDGLVAQGADPQAVKQGVDSALAQGHATVTGGGKLLDEHTMDVAKGARDTLQKVALPPEVKTDIETKAPTPKAAANALSTVRQTMAKYPARDGWVQIKPKAVELKPDGSVKKVEWVAANEGENRFTFNLDPATGKADRKTAEARAQTLADKMAAEVRDVEQRAASGDQAAQVIQRQRQWYTSMRTRLREEFGGTGQLFAELLGATSPNTAVPQNWDSAIESLRHFVRGEYDQQLGKMEQWIADGKPLNKFPADDKIRKASGALFGMNSGGAMQAMLDMWKAVEPGSAPKAKNFAGNLIGTSDHATIDVWAARTLQRLSGGKRLPALLSVAVDGTWDAKAVTVNGQYGFAMDVFKKAGEQVGMDPHELHAFMWFKEKELWTRNNWTNLAGEGGSFEQMANSAGLSRYQSGISVQQDVPPTDATMAVAQPRLTQSLQKDPGVVAFRALPTTGMYAGSRERAFDMELTASPEWNPSKWVADLATVAQEKNQYDVLVSKVLNSDEVSANARPGVEVYFADQQSMEQVLPLIEKMVGAGHDGFTFVVDPRMRYHASPGQEAGQYVGVRLQYVPEIQMRWDDAFRQQMSENPDAVQAIIAEKADAMLDLVNELQTQNGVLSAHRFDYDSFVMGKENYGEYTSGANAGGAGASQGAPWFGRTYRENLGAAAQRLNAGADSAAGVSQPGPAAAGASQAVTGGSAK